MGTRHDLGDGKGEDQGRGTFAQAAFPTSDHDSARDPPRGGQTSWSGVLAFSGFGTAHKGP